MSYVKLVKKKVYYDGDRIPDSTFAQGSLDALAARGYGHFSRKHFTWVGYEVFPKSILFGGLAKTNIKI